MIKITRKCLSFVYSVTLDYQFSSVKVLNHCGKLQAVEVANNPNGSEEIGPVGCQIFGGHKKHCGSTVKDGLQQSRNKKYHDDT